MKANFDVRAVAAVPAMLARLRRCVRRERRPAAEGRDPRIPECTGLWGPAFGNGFLGQRPDALYFTARPDDEAHGAHGVISMTKFGRKGED